MLYCSFHLQYLFSNALLTIKRQQQQQQQQHKNNNNNNILSIVNLTNTQKGGTKIVYLSIHIKKNWITWHSELTKLPSRLGLDINVNLNYR